MDDVDYLVEDNEMDDFCLSSEMNGTHGKSTFENGPGQQLLRRQPKENWHDRVQAGNKMQPLGMFQPSYLPEIQIRLVIGYFRLSMSEKNSCNTN